MPFDLKSNVPFLLYRVASALGSDANSVFKAAGATTMHARVLLALLSDENWTVGDLCEFTAIDQSTMSHSLNALRRRELISKRRLASDNRTVRVRLTAKGRDVAGRCAKVSLRFNEVLVRGLSDDEIATLRTLLCHLFENCGQSEATRSTLPIASKDAKIPDPSAEIRTVE